MFFVYITFVNKPKGMFMTKKTRNILVHTGAGVAALLLVVFGVKQCSDKNDARSDLDAVRAEAESITNNCNEMALTYEQALKDYAGRAQVVVDSLANELVVRDSTIAVLRDSLDVTAKKLDDCLNCKKNNKKRPAAAKKPVAAKKTAAKTCTTVKTVANAGNCADSTTMTTVEVSKPVTNATGVSIGSGAQNNHVNINNGTVNNYYAPVDTMKKCASASQTVVIRRIYCTRQK